MGFFSNHIIPFPLWVLTGRQPRFDGIRGKRKRLLKLMLNLGFLYIRGGREREGEGQRERERERWRDGEIGR